MPFLSEHFNLLQRIQFYFSGWNKTAGGGGEDSYLKSLRSKPDKGNKIIQEVDRSGNQTRHSWAGQARYQSFLQ